MPTRRAKKETALAPLSKIDRNKIVSILSSVYKTLREVLIMSFLIIWILVGAFFIWFISANFQQGAFSQLMSKPQPAAEISSDLPSEVDMPGIGRVNVTCVQNSLKEESIVKVIQEGSNESLTTEEKAALEKCKVADTATSPTP